MDSEDNSYEMCSGSNTCILTRITPLAQELNCLDKTCIADICVNQIRRMVHAKWVSLYFLDEGSDILHLVRHNHPYLINNIVSLNQNAPSAMVKAVRSKELIVIGGQKCNKGPRVGQNERQYAGNYKTTNCIIAPLICQGSVVGVLNLSEKENAGQFTEGDIALIELCRQLVGASVGNVKLFEKTQYQARTDGLTNLLNHKTFYEVLEKELRRSQRYGGIISIIMVDIDNLKPINDQYGHRAGDLAIKHVARCLVSCIRKIDTAARYGGDEFSVILPNTPQDKAVIVAQRMVETVSEKPIVWEKSKISVSISIGVGTYDVTFSPEEITRHSDEALYAAKLSGKNTIEIFRNKQ